MAAIAAASVGSRRALVFCGGRGKCSGNAPGINHMRADLVFRGARQECTHNSKKISRFAADLVFRQIPGKSVQWGRHAQTLPALAPAPGAAGCGTLPRNPGSRCATAPESSSAVLLGTPVSGRRADDRPHADQAGTTAGRSSTASSEPEASCFIITTPASPLLRSLQRGWVSFGKQGRVTSGERLRLGRSKAARRFRFLLSPFHLTNADAPVRGEPRAVLRWTGRGRAGRSLGGGPPPRGSLPAGRPRVSRARRPPRRHPC